MSKIILFFIYLALADFCTIRSVRLAFPAWFTLHRKKFLIVYWAIHLLLFYLFIISRPEEYPRPLRAFTFMFFLCLYFCKFFLILGASVAALLDLISTARKVRTNPLANLSDREFFDTSKNGEYIPEANLNSASEIATGSPPGLTRAQFVSRTGMALASLPFIALNAGMIQGVYDYRIRQVKLVLPNLPSAFEGMHIAQISDIHSGSFYNKKAVSAGIDLVMSLKAEVIFFTGDLVNDMAIEMKDYQDIFSRVKAPLGVYSILGNHDYGDYAWWPDAAAKKKNLDDVKKIHGLMGYQLLLNENRTLRIGRDEIAILGVENWGSFSRFPKYGRVELALRGVEDLPVKLLLSHDPTHWKAKVIPEFPNVDVMFSGHTHGMQMGIRTREFQWSPVQYVYPEWAGLYRQDHQQLYVNVGYGFLGYPGRLGMNPEVTLFTLSSKS